MDNHCQVVISSSYSPLELEGIQDRIVSRLSWGLVADVNPTDFELRLGILQSKVDTVIAHNTSHYPEEKKRPDVPIEVLEFLANKVTSNVRELEGSLNRVIAYATLVGRNITLEMTREVLQELILSRSDRVTISDIQHQTAEYFNIRVADLLSERRSHNILRPRQIAMYLAQEMTDNSLPEIGKRFGRRNHKMVTYSIRKIHELLISDTSLSKDLERIRNVLEE
jgi:chromosomal replication initiator protein